METADLARSISLFNVQGMLEKTTTGASNHDWSVYDYLADEGTWLLFNFKPLNRLASSLVGGGGCRLTRRAFHLPD
jgi:hypothetical protein